MDAKLCRSYFVVQIRMRNTFKKQLTRKAVPKIYNIIQREFKKKKDNF